MMYMKRLTAVGSELAQEIFDILYPVGNANGNEKTRKAALKRLIEIAKEQSQPAQVMPLPESGFTGLYEQGSYVMLWSYPYKWVTLYKTAPTARELAES